MGPLPSRSMETEAGSAARTDSGARQRRSRSDGSVLIILITLRIIGVKPKIQWFTLLKTGRFSLEFL